MEIKVQVQARLCDSVVFFGETLEFSVLLFTQGYGWVPANCALGKIVVRLPMFV